MASCGMYDAAGEWLYNVGMPAKSGVGGGILAVLPGQLAVAVYSPPLDQHGNSVRGVAVCRELSSRYNLHLFNASSPGLSVIRHRSSAALISSNRSRPAAEIRLLRRHGAGIHLLEIQGNVIFSAAERIIREISAAAPGAFAFILDFSRVPHMDLVSVRLLMESAAALAEGGVWIHLTRSHHLPVLRRYARKRYAGNLPALIRWEEDADTALEFCENRLLESLGRRRASDVAVELRECELVAGFSDEELTVLAPLLEPRHFEKGGAVFEAGQKADEMLVILRGKASVFLRLPNGNSYRVTTCTPGMTFGEMALLDQSPRSATIHADTGIEALALTSRTFHFLAMEHPAIYSKILGNIARGLAARLRKRNTEVINAHVETR